jgi:hypothetical protein
MNNIAHLQGRRAWKSGPPQDFRKYARNRITGSTLSALTVASEMLDDEMWWWKAIGLLGKLGTAARLAVPDLERPLAHDDEFRRYDAERALKKIMAGE